jgi:phosphate uptake regulator
MELRRVQLTGGSSITVTLPKSWVDHVALKPGDIVRCLVQPDGSLAVYPHEKGQRVAQQHIIAFESQGERELFRQIVAGYLLGFDAIIIKARGSIPDAARAAVRQAVRRIIGLEITDEDNHSITVQDLLDPREFQTRKALRRMSILTRAMQEEAVRSLAIDDATLVARAEERDDEIDKLYWLVNKQYHAMLRDTSYATLMGMSAHEGLNHLLLARLVERTADHAARITQQAAGIRRTKALDPFMSKLEKQAQRAMELFQKGMSAFFKPDAAAAHTIIEEAGRLHDAQERLLKEAGSVKSEVLSHLAFVIESIGRTAAYAADVSEVTVNHVAGLGKP